MDKNVGGLDRYGRIGIGLLLVVAGGAAIAEFWEVGIAVGAIALLAGAVLFVTGTTQKCPINDKAGIDTTNK